MVVGYQHFRKLPCIYGYVDYIGASTTLVYIGYIIYSICVKGSRCLTFTRSTGFSSVWETLLCTVSSLARSTWNFQLMYPSLMRCLIASRLLPRRWRSCRREKSTSTLIGEIQVRRRMDENGGLKVGVLPLSPLKTDMSPENWWLEDEISFWDGPFLCDMLIFGGGFYLALTIFKTDGPVTKTTPAKMH